MKNMGSSMMVKALAAKGYDGMGKKKKKKPMMKMAGHDKM